MADVKKDTGARIAAAREARNWTQGELAWAASLSISTIQAYEQGLRGNLETIAQIADALGVSVSTLVSSGTPYHPDNPNDAAMAAYRAEVDPLLNRLSGKARNMALDFLRLLAGQ